MGTPLIDLTGKRIGSLVPQSYDRGTSKWSCRCDCGLVKDIKAQGRNLREERP